MLGFLSSAMASASQRFMSYAQGEGDQDKIKKLFNISLILHLLTAVLVLIILEIAGYFFFSGTLNIAVDRIATANAIYQFMVLSTFFTIISVPYEAVITSHENMLFYAILGILESVFKLLIAYYLSYSPFDHLLVYGFLMAALAILLLIIKQVYCHTYYVECKISLFKYFDKVLFRQMTEFAMWNFFGSATSILANYGQSLVINIFFGTALNAAQGIATQVSGQLSAFAHTMLRALNPLLDKSEGAGNRAMMLKASMMGSKVGFFLLMIFYVPALLEMPYIFKLWLVNPPESVVIFCRLQLMRDLLGQLFYTLSASIAAVGNIKRFQIYSSLLSLFPLAIAALLFYYDNPAQALYWVYLAYTGCTSLLILYFAKINCALPAMEFLRTVFFRCLLVFIISLSISILPLFLLEEGIQRLILECIIGFVISVLMIWLLGFTRQERYQISLVVNNMLNSFRVRLRRNKNIST